MTSDMQVLMDNDDIAEAVGAINALENEKQKMLAVCLAVDQMDRDEMTEARDKLGAAADFGIGADSPAERETARTGYERTKALVCFHDSLDQLG